MCKALFVLAVAILIAWAGVGLIEAHGGIYPGPSLTGYTKTNQGAYTEGGPGQFFEFYEREGYRPVIKFTTSDPNTIWAWDFNGYTIMDTNCDGVFDKMIMPRPGPYHMPECFNKQKVVVAESKPLPDVFGPDDYRGLPDSTRDIYLNGPSYSTDSADLTVGWNRVACEPDAPDYWYFPVATTPHDYQTAITPKGKKWSTKIVLVDLDCSGNMWYSLKKVGYYYNYDQIEQYDLPRNSKPTRHGAAWAKIVDSVCRQTCKGSTYAERYNETHGYDD